MFTILEDLSGLNSVASDTLQPTQSTSETQRFPEPESITFFEHIPFRNLTDQKWLWRSPNTHFTKIGEIRIRYSWNNMIQKRNKPHGRSPAKPPSTCSWRPTALNERYTNQVSSQDSCWDEKSRDRDQQHGLFPFRRCILRRNQSLPFFCCGLMGATPAAWLIRAWAPQLRLFSPFPH